MYNTTLKGECFRIIVVKPQCNGMIDERMSKMVQRRIMLKPNDVQNFVNIASECDFDIDIAYNSYVIDAKSILGVLGLDLSKVLTVTYQGYNEKLENFLTGSALAC